MKLQEYQSKAIFREYGIPVPPGKVATTVDEAVACAKEVGYPVVVKAQVLVGGRGKAGGIKIANNEKELREHASRILGMEIKGLKVHKVLVAHAIDIKKEIYLGIIVDRKTKSPVVMVSPEGGVDIEEVARTHPEKIYKLTCDPLVGLLPHAARALAFKLFVEPEYAIKTADILLKLYKTFVSIDASLVEINPYVLDNDGNLWAVDAKIIADDNALFRHKDIAEMREILPGEEKELEAKEKGLSYVKLDGNIGCVVNGAGLAMATMDIIKKYGGEPANFLDIGGSSSPEKVLNALRILLSDKNVKVIFFNIFGGITRCDDVAKGIIQALEEYKIDLPIVIRLTGTNEEEARKILAKTKLIPVSSMAEGAQRAIELLKS